MRIISYPAEYGPKMIEVLEENPGVGMVTGNEFHRRFDIKKAMDNVRYLGNRFVALMQHVLNGVKMRDPLTGLRVVRWGILKNWNPRSKSFDVEAELNYYVQRKGYRVRKFPFNIAEDWEKRSLS